MAEGDRPVPRELTPEERGHRELKASRHELSSALTRQVDWLVKQMNLTPDDAAARVRQPLVFQPEEREAEQIDWFEVSRVMESDPERGERLWNRIKEDALRELQTGIRSARAIEPKVGDKPFHRARFAAVLNSLRASLQPRDELESLLLQQMATAYEMHLLWLDRAALRTQEEDWQGDRDRRREWERLSPAQQERYALDHGWMPPRVSTAAAIDQAVMIADRYQRAFLRLLKAFRDMRRLVGTVVLAGGQLNLAEKQIVTTTTEQTRATPSRRARTRSPAAGRRAKANKDANTIVMVNGEPDAAR